jgi:hypothetical protein
VQVNGEPRPILDQRIRPLSPKQRLVVKALAAGMVVGGFFGYNIGNDADKSVNPAAAVSAEEIKVFNKYSRDVVTDVKNGLTKVKQSALAKGYVWYSENRDHPYVAGALEDVYDELGIYQQSLEKEAKIEPVQLTAEEATNIGLPGVSELQASVRRYDIVLQGQKFLLEERKFNLRDANDQVKPYVHFVATAR